MECDSSISYHFWFQLGAEMNTEGRMPQLPVSDAKVRFLQFSDTYLGIIIRLSFPKPLIYLNEIKPLGCFGSSII